MSLIVSNKIDSFGIPIRYTNTKDAGLLGVTGKPAPGTLVATGKPISSGLVLCFPMNEGSGTTIDDYSTTADNGTLSNATAWATDATWTEELNLAGTYNVSIPYNSAFHIETYSVGILFKSTMTGFGAMASSSLSGVYPMSLFIGDNSTPGSINLQAGASETSNTSAYNNGAWHYLVATRTQGANMAIFVDGIYKGNTTDGNSPGSTLNTNPLVLGWWNSGSNPFNGALGCFMYWNRVLTGIPGSIGGTATGEIAQVTADPFTMFADR